MADTGVLASDAAVRSASVDVRPTLRFLTCGSVDDGKSTLVGRLLYDQNLVFDDHLAALDRDSKKHGTTGPDVAPQDIVPLIPKQGVNPAIPLERIRAPQSKERVIAPRVLFACNWIPVQEPET